MNTLTAEEFSELLDDLKEEVWQAPQLQIQGPRFQKTWHEFENLLQDQIVPNVIASLMEAIATEPPDIDRIKHLSAVLERKCEVHRSEIPALLVLGRAKQDLAIDTVTFLVPDLSVSGMLLRENRVFTI